MNLSQNVPDSYVSESRQYEDPSIRCLLLDEMNPCREVPFPLGLLQVHQLINRCLQELHP